MKLFADGHNAVSGYRPDIDGLRALAVLSVVIHHAFPQWLPGGFVGVDVFFVISGYLISAHLLNEIAEERFSFREFYKRRILRIFPGLLLVLFGCAGFGWIALTPTEYEQLGTQIIGGAAFFANFIFWSQAGYFDAASDTKPLLHLWSLGIEEQFYIVWPVFLLFAYKYGKAKFGILIYAVCCLSLFYSIWLVQHNQTADFYSPITRCWEFGTGAMLAYGEFSGTFQKFFKKFNGLRLLVLPLLLTSLFVINSESSFPGAWAIIPVLASALVIGCGAPTTDCVQRVLSISPLVSIGLLSYSLYLWHWPILTFARILEGGTPSDAVRAALLLFAFLLSVISYKFFEKPIRFVDSKWRTLTVYALVVAMIMAIVFGYVVRSSSGVKFRSLGQTKGNLSTLVLGVNKEQYLKDCLVQPELKKQLDFCYTTNAGIPEYAVIGDSKSEPFFYGLADLHPERIGVLIGTVNPFAYTQEPRDKKTYESYQAIVGEPSLRKVFLVNALRVLFEVDPATGFITKSNQNRIEELKARFEKLIRDIEQQGKQVYFVMDNPTLADPQDCVSGGLTTNSWLNSMLYRNENPRCTISLQAHLNGTRVYREFVQELSRTHPGLVVIDPTDVLCEEGECRVMNGDGYLYSYTDHLSDFGAKRVIYEKLRWF